MQPIILELKDDCIQVCTYCRGRDKIIRSMRSRDDSKAKVVKIIGS